MLKNVLGCCAAFLLELLSTGGRTPGGLLVNEKYLEHIYSVSLLIHRRLKSKRISASSLSLSLSAAKVQIKFDARETGGQSYKRSTIIN